MRFTATFLLVLLAVGCGAGDPHNMFTTNFTPPALTQLSPSTEPVNSTPFVMTVTGTNFGGDAVVYWNGAPQSTRFVSSKQLLVSITGADLTEFGLAQVYVRTAGMSSNTMDFDVTAQ